MDSSIRHWPVLLPHFYPQQPDLNWRNPAVEKAMLDTTRWWYKRGVSGFRLDAVDTLFEDPNLTDNPVDPGSTNRAILNKENKYNTKFPEVHEELQKLRKIADESNAVLDRRDLDSRHRPS